MCFAASRRDSEDGTTLDNLQGLPAVYVWEAHHFPRPMFVWTLVPKGTVCNEPPHLKGLPLSVHMLLSCCTLFVWVWFGSVLFGCSAGYVLPGHVLCPIKGSRPPPPPMKVGLPLKRFTTPAWHMACSMWQPTKNKQKHAPFKVACLISGLGTGLFSARRGLACGPALWRTSPVFLQPGDWQ